MRRVRHWAWLAAGSALLLPQVCPARVPTRLVYARAQSAKDCPDEQALVEAVTARLAYDPFSPWGDQTILASVSRAGSSVLGRAELIDHDGISQGSREVKLQDGDCRELILALSLAISITLDPLHVDAGSDSAPPDAEPSAAVEQPRAKDAPVSPEQAPASPARDVLPSTAAPNPTRASWHVSGGALTTYALASRLTFGARLGLEARRAPWSLALEGWASLPATWELEGGGGQIQASLWAGALVPCFEVVTRLRLFGPPSPRERDQPNSRPAESKPVLRPCGTWAPLPATMLRAWSPTRTASTGSRTSVCAASRS
ncbi:MAG TPA: hypothetical protein VJV79_01570 [Polyangiaceae bacterium]|nr:hypothetical protein [Polyangiaceae bacterium]